MQPVCTLFLQVLESTENELRRRIGKGLNNLEFLKESEKFVLSKSARLPPRAEAYYEPSRILARNRALAVGVIMLVLTRSLARARQLHDAGTLRWGPLR